MGVKSKIPSQIAVDGPAASGKSTVSQLTAQKVDAYYVNSGDSYRALTWLALEAAINPEKDKKEIIDLLEKYQLSYRYAEGQTTNELHLFIDNDPADRTLMRSPDVTGKVSYIARIPEVRSYMINVQRKVKSMGLILMEGRDIGTVIFPEAVHKFFLTATPKERAQRRLQQSGEVYNRTTLASLTKEIHQRDTIDSTRKIAPLKPADDAIIIDTTLLTIDQVVAKMVATIKQSPS